MLKYVGNVPTVVTKQNASEKSSLLDGFRSIFILKKSLYKN
jgi:hypothetical protein